MATFLIRARHVVAVMAFTFTILLFWSLLLGGVPFSPRPSPPPPPPSPPPFSKVADRLFVGRHILSGKNFFTFDPTVDIHVSYHMLTTGGIFDEHVMRAFDVSASSLLSGPHEGIVLDVGSNLGCLSLHAGIKGYKVHAFDIQASVLARLSLSVESHGLENRIYTHRLAISNDTDIALKRFDMFPENPGGVGAGQKGEIPVYTARLDDIYSQGEVIAFMKIDTEGGELGVLQSADRLLRTGRILSLVSEVRSHQASIAKLLLRYRYKCRLLNDTLVESCPSESSLYDLVADIEAIPRDRFDDMFCCR